MDVTPEATFRLSTPLTVERGRIALGVLDVEKNAFIYSSCNPEEEHTFRSGKASKIQIIISNCNPKTHDKRSEFKMRTPQLELLGRAGMYPRVLTNAYEEARKQN